MSELPLPSISRVQAQAPCPMRLPSYRSSHRLRYHPYPMSAPPRHEDLMTVSHKPSLTNRFLAHDLQHSMRDHSDLIFEPILLPAPALVSGVARAHDTFLNHQHGLLVRQR